MKELKWDNTLSVQVEEIDADHQRLVDLFNLLNRTLEEKAAPDYIEAVLAELIACTDWHFKHEERLMLQYRYPDYQKHRQEHEELLASIRDLQAQRQGRLLSDDDIEFLEHWLTGHILGLDMDLGAWLNSVM